MTDRGREFADIVYTILVIEKAPGLEQVADALGMAYATLHSRVINRTCFSVDEIRALLRIVPDARLASYIFEETAFIAADRPISGPSGQRETMQSIQSAATRVVVQATGVLEIVDSILTGGGFDHRNEHLVQAEIAEAERALASLKMLVANSQHQANWRSRSIRR